MQRNTVIVIIIIACAVSMVVGFASGGLITKPNRNLYLQKETSFKKDIATLEKSNSKLTTANTDYLNELNDANGYCKKQAAEIDLLREKLQAKLSKDKTDREMTALKKNGISEHSENQKEKSDIANAKLAFQKIKEAGLIYSTDLENGTFRVNLYNWNLLDVDNKQKVVLILSNYRKVIAGYKRMEILSNLNDTKLAKFNVWSGVTIYQ